VSDIAEKLADLDQECKQIRTRALAICDKSELSVDDRKQIEECIELILEIKDYAARLNRSREKWSTR